jgi:hypothetical protein
MRATHCLENIALASNAIGKTISIYSTPSGMISLVRTSDGQAYQIDIKPASLSDFQPFINYFTKGRKWAERFRARMNRSLPVKTRTANN